MKKLWNLNYWDTGEWQVIEERLSDANVNGIYSFSPARKDLFRSLELCDPDSTRVCILGQDPYPSPAHATGVAFSVPEDCKALPPTLTNIFREYQSDLHYPAPTKGDLTPWCRRGVFLWNCIPTTHAGRSLSHQRWEEWWPLTEEIVDVLDKSGHVVFACFGGIARDFFFKKDRQSEVIVCSHPSPRASAASKSPFFGSRCFSTINAKLNGQGLDAIDWRLP